MEIPRSERQGTGEIYNDRMGQCKCGMLKTQIAGIMKCPNCDTKSATKSGKINNIEHVPQSAFKKVKRIGLDGKEYEEFVAKTKKEMQKELKMQDRKGSAQETTKDLPVNSPTVPVVVTLKIDPTVQLINLEQFFDTIPAKNMAEFKRVDKLRKSIKKLRTQVEEYLGGK